MRKFSFYENVLIGEDDTIPPEIRGKEGVIMGMTNGSNQNYFYSVSIGEASSESWILEEKHLTSLLFFSEREDFYDGTTIRVSKDGKIL